MTQVAEQQPREAANAAYEGESLVTRTAVDASTRPFSAGEPRTVELKGIATPVEVVSIVWR